MKHLGSVIISISNKFINLRREQVDYEIENALKEVSSILEIDSAYIFIFEDEGMFLRQTHEWHE
ncbi:MAG: hypothetical protein K0R31_1517 [Clostridiales bacterium]|nr:hypothetical protein [Clostridiales bacterium]